MLESAIYYKRVFNHLEAVDGNFTHCPRFDEWVKIEKIFGFLKVFYEVTCAFSGSKYPTVSVRDLPSFQKLKLDLVPSDCYHNLGGYKSHENSCSKT